MNANADIPFVKMNGLGNDFVVIDARSAPLHLNEHQVRAIAERKTGIGCDQLIKLEPSPRGDVYMRIYNADGGEVGACGNAARCIADLMFKESGSNQVSIETESGLLACTPGADGTITVDMGEPRFAWNEIPLAEEFHDTRAIELQIGPIDDPILHSPSVVNVGNPHAIFWVEDVDAYELDKIGPLLEFHPIFPERANISIAQVTAPDALRLRTWERGVGLTRACGTAACAAAVCAARKKLTGRVVTVTLPGGPLAIEWRESDNHILMTGPCEREYDGVIAPELLAGSAA